MRKAIHKHLTFVDLKDMLEQTGKLYGDRPAYIFKTEEEKFREVTHKEFRDEIKSLGTALVDLGLKDKRVAVISENRYEWGVAYLAIATGTGVVVPLDKALPNNEIESLIIRSEVEAIFYSNKYNEIMNEIKEKGNTNVKCFISMDLEKGENGIYSEKELTAKGKELIDKGDRRFLDAKIDNEKMGIMLFTSGTTSVSKAVMLSHKNICSNLADIASVIKVDENDRFLSFLPLHHTFECTVGFLYPISKGGAIAFCEGIRHIAENINEFQITAMISVPILFESMYRKVMKGIEKKGKLEDVKKGIKITQFLLKFGIDIRRKVFKEIHDLLGGNIKLFISGAASLEPSIEEKFRRLGFNMVQGYGLTETSPVVAMGNKKYHKTGSIGKCVPSDEVKLLDVNKDGIGELAVKGPNVMLEYYENKEATEKVLKDGWFQTGDLARIDEDGYIFICGRKKSVIVLKNGKNIFPEEMETLINKEDGVEEAFIFGKPISKDPNDIKIFVKIVYIKESFEGKTETEIKEYFNEKIKSINKTMPHYKAIRGIIISDKPLIKTTTNKIKREKNLEQIMKEL